MCKSEFAVVQQRRSKDEILAELDETIAMVIRSLGKQADDDWCREYVAQGECAAAFRQGVSTAVVQPVEKPAVLLRWLLVVQRWLQQNTPQDFGYFRSRWSCALLAEVLA